MEYVKDKSGVAFLTSENVGVMTLTKLDQLKFVEERFNEMNPVHLKKRGFDAQFGWCISWKVNEFNLDIVANVNQAVAIIRPIEPENIFNEFMLTFLNSSGESRYLERVLQPFPMLRRKEFLVPLANDEQTKSCGNFGD